MPDFLEKIVTRNRIFFPAIVVRRSVYQELGGFRSDLHAADWDLWIRIAAHYPVWYEPTTLVAWRCHSKSGSAALVISGEFVADERRVIEMNRCWLPPDRAEAIAGSARESLYLKAVSMTSQEGAVLGLVEELIKVLGRCPIDRVGVANALLRAARIHYRQGRRFQALVLMVRRAIIIGPIVLRGVLWNIFIHRTFPLRKRLGLRRRVSIEHDARRV